MLYIKRIKYTHNTHLTVLPSSAALSRLCSIDGLAVVKRYDQTFLRLLRLIPPPSSETLITTCHRPYGQNYEGYTVSICTWQGIGW